MSATVDIQGVTKRYGSFVAIDDVSLAIGQGEFVVLLGPSGSGKTTLLSMIGGFQFPDSGEILISGNRVTDLPPAKRPTATVFQDYALFPHFSVAGNIAFGLAQCNVPKRERLAKIEEVLAIVGLEGYASRRIHELSGGQRQRVALARAIAVQPEVLLLDEPLGALDAKIRRQMQEELLGIQKRIGTTFVHVTHDQEEAMTIADQIVVVNQGKIEDVGPPRRIYNQPTTCFTATFMGDSNLWQGKTMDQSGDGVLIETTVGPLIAKCDRPANGVVHVSVRPERLRMGADGSDLNKLAVVHVEEVVFQGTYQRVHARANNADSTQLLFLAEPDAALNPGDAIELHVDPADVIVLAD